MDGRQVYNFAVKVVSEGIVDLMERNHLTADDISWIVPHQANVRNRGCGKTFKDPHVEVLHEYRGICQHFRGVHPDRDVRDVLTGPPEDR